MFVVSTKHAAENNSEGAKLREATRIAMITHGLHSLGHEVVLSDMHPALVSSGRWKHFKHIPVSKNATGISISAARGGCAPSRHDVLVKTSVGPKNDKLNSKMCSVFVCVERCEEFGNALDIPFFVHDRFLCELMERGAMEAYLSDDIDELRGRFSYEKTNDVVFNGHCGYGRMPFFHDCPEWVDARFYDTHSISAWEHAQWLCNSKAAVALSGDTPKTNLPPLLALLGVPIVSPIAEVNTPQMDENSMVLFEDWNQVQGEIRSDETLQRIADNATEVYLEGWSPIGVARQIARKFGV